MDLRRRERNWHLLFATYTYIYNYMIYFMHIVYPPSFIYLIMNIPQMDPQFKKFKTAFTHNVDVPFDNLANLKLLSDVENDAFIQSEASKQNIIPNTDEYRAFIAGVAAYIRGEEFMAAAAADAAADAAAAARRQAMRRDRQHRQQRRGGSKKHSNRRKKHSKTHRR